MPGERQGRASRRKTRFSTPTGALNATPRGFLFKAAKTETLLRGFLSQSYILLHSVSEFSYLYKIKAALLILEHSERKI